MPLPTLAGRFYHHLRYYAAPLRPLQHQHALEKYKRNLCRDVNINRQRVPAFGQKRTFAYSSVAGNAERVTSLFLLTCGVLSELEAKPQQEYVPSQIDVIDLGCESLRFYKKVAPLDLAIGLGAEPEQ